MDKLLDFSESVYSLCQAHPELPQLLAELGFTEITKKMALETVGRMMTIPKGAALKGIDLTKVITVLQNKGYQVVYLPSDAPEAAEGKTDQEKRIDMLTGYIKRLGEGEDLEQVRKEFVANFKDVDAAEIAQAEQTLMKSGVPLNEVQRLCDVHSALFHGATKTEKIANAEKEVAASLANKKPKKLKRTDGGDIKYQELCQIEGHPLQILTMENEAISKQLAAMRNALETGEDVLPQLNKTRQIAVHYARKGDLLYPPLKEVHGFAGPSDVMWTVDNEIRDTLRRLYTDAEKNPYRLQQEDWQENVKAQLTRAEEMVYKETNILYPLCAKTFTDEEWKQIGRDQEDFEPCLIDSVPHWQEALDEGKTPQGNTGDISLPSGHFNARQLEAILNTIPLEITFIDENNINRYFNDGKGKKLFKRPLAALDREVFTCHPPKAQPVVRGVIQELKNGKESVDIWTSRDNEPVLIRYMAVRDKQGNYVGTMECVQKMGFAKDHFQK